MTTIDMWPTSLVASGRNVIQSHSNRLPVVRHHAPARQPARPTNSSARGASEPHPSDGDLGRRLAAGDTEALRELYARYGGPMLTVALHLLRDRHLAEEALHAAMLKAWRAVSAFDTTRPLAPWLYAIVRHCAIDVLRHEQRHQRASQKAMEGERTTGGNDAYESATTAWAVRAALERLPAKEYAVMRLTYFEGLTQSEIAARLDIPIGTVKTRAARAHHRLHGVLSSQL
jgi:RNA polymerase sigma-70 factor, ECF subfamily